MSQAEDSLRSHFFYWWIPLGLACSSTSVNPGEDGADASGSGGASGVGGAGQGGTGQGGGTGGSSGSASACPTAVGAAMCLKRFGDGADQQLKKFAPTKDGGVLMTGRFSGVIDLGKVGKLTADANGLDGFVVKLDACCEPEWGHLFGGASSGEGISGMSVAETPDGNSAVVALLFDGNVDLGIGDGGVANSIDGAIVALDGGGNTVWAHPIGGSGAEYLFDLVLDDTGNIFVTGSFSDQIDFGGTPLVSQNLADTFVAKLDNQGTEIWSTRLGEVGNQNGSRIAVAPDGSVYVAGSSDGAFMVGTDPLPEAAASSVWYFVAKLDSAGNSSWGRSSSKGGTAYAPQGLAVGDEVSVFGTFTGTIGISSYTFNAIGGQDLYLARYAIDGSSVTPTQLSGPGNETAGGMAADPNGTLLLTGFFNGMFDLGNSAFDSNASDAAFLARRPISGPSSSIYFGENDHQSGNSVAAVGTQAIFLGGHLSGSMNVGNQTFTSMGGNDIYVLKLPSGFASGKL